MKTIPKKNKLATEIKARARGHSNPKGENLIKARTLSQALPFIQKFHNKLIVVKLGGSTLDSEESLLPFIQDLVLLKTVGIHPVLIHGGGNKISRTLEQLGKKPKFLEGLRITDPETMEITQMVLAGLLNKSLVSLINGKGGKAVGLSGQDGGIAQARPLKPGKHDYGQVGEITQVNPELITQLLERGYIPVIAPIAYDTSFALSSGSQSSLNINADTFATEIALSLKAEKLIFISNVPGVLRDPSRLDSCISSLPLSEIDPLIKTKKIQGGMIPKLRAAQKALTHGVEKVHFITEKIDHSLLVELFTEEGIGTLIFKPERKSKKPGPSLRK